MVIVQRSKRSRMLLAAAAMPALLLASCGDDSDQSAADDNDTAAADGDGSGDTCDGYPTEDIDWVVPYSPGGGFDTWSRTIAPALEEHLPNSVNISVFNRSGAGGITGVSEVFSAEPDGYTIGITEPGVLATAQIAGTSELDFGTMTAIGQVTRAPEVIVVNANSEWDSIEDVQAAAQQEPILTGGGGLAAINIITFDVLEIPFENVLHEGSSEALLSVIRGDTQLALYPLTSVAEGIRAGDLKPLLLIGTPPTEENPDADVVQGVPTLDEVAGQEGLGAALEQHRLVLAPPDTPDCVRQILSESLGATFEDEDFLATVTDAGLLPVHLDAEEAQGILENTIETLRAYEELLAETLRG